MKRFCTDCGNRLSDDEEDHTYYDFITDARKQLCGTCDELGRFLYRMQRESEELQLKLLVRIIEMHDRDHGVFPLKTMKPEYENQRPRAFIDGDLSGKITSTITEKGNRHMLNKGLANVRRKRGDKTMT